MEGMRSGLRLSPGVLLARPDRLEGLLEVPVVAFEERVPGAPVSDVRTGMGSDREPGWTRRPCGVSMLPSRRTLRNSCSSMPWSVAHGSATSRTCRSVAGFTMPGDTI
jgi:hypothetical protein